MKKSIYKITNLINGKVYIGQSKDVKKKIKEHQQKYATSSVSKIRNAINKYGIQNFKIEILEEDIENYNEREMFWISYYNATNSDCGYNITAGGENPPIKSGEESCFVKLSDEEVIKIIQDIKDGLPYKQIKNKYNVSEAYLVKLNKGEVRKFADISYPIVKHNNIKIEQNKIHTIIDVLQNTTKSSLQIAKEYNIGISTVDDINNGKCPNCPNNIKYPIREKHCRISKQQMDKLISDIKDNKLKFSDIETKYNVSKTFVNRVNNGKSHRIKDEIYPLRKSSQRVY